MIVTVCVGTGQVSWAQSLDHRQVNQYVAADGTLQPVKSAGDWAKRRAQILKNVQEVMGPLPAQALQRLPVEYKVLEQTAGDGYQRLTIQFAAEPGEPAVADLYLPTTEGAEGKPVVSDEKRAAIVALHPTGALGKRIVAGDGPLGNRQYGVELAQRGYVVICPDYPSFGDLKDYDFAQAPYQSGSMKGIVNHMRCVDLLAGLPQVDAERIGAIGHSLGGHNAIFLGVFDERVKAVISSCGWTPFHDYKQGNLTGWTSPRYMPRIASEYEKNPDRVPFDFPELIATLAPRHFFSSSPEQDDNFDVAGVKKGIAAAQPIFNLLQAGKNLELVIPLCDHDFPTEIRSDAYQFLDRALSHKPTREIGFGDELPRIPALSPQQALETFRLADGFRIELTAAEPDVVDPVAMCFDEDGRLFVIEMRGYSEDDGQNLGRVRLLEDTDGDGRFDRSTVFAEGFSWPTAIFCSRGGVYVGAAPDIHFLKDTTGDGVADQQEVVFTGFGKTNVQALLNSFRWGLDNRIYGATSANGGLVRRPDQPENAAINLAGRNFSFDPLTRELRPESGAAQHGMGFDDWGRLFVCSNGNHFQMVMYQDRYAARNPLLKAPAARQSVADDGPQAEVFRISPVEPWRIVRTRLRASGRVKGAVEFGGKNAGYFTSATGVNFFRGDGWNDATKGTAIIGDVGSNIVHRKKVTAEGIGLRGSRIDTMSELVSSNDIWFRPVQYENGPDGALHVLDMYREVIEHPWSLPPEIKQHLDLTSGRDRGRLYRIVGSDFQSRPAPQLSRAENSELVALLDHPNAWHRETAQRLLIERQATEVGPQLKAALSEFSPLGKLHGIYTLSGLKQLQAKDLVAMWDDAEDALVCHLLILSEQFTGDDAIRNCVKETLQRQNPMVRYQLAFTLGEFPAEWNAPLLTELLLAEKDSSWIRFAVFSSLSTQIPELLNGLTENAEFVNSAAGNTTFNELVELIARRGKATETQLFAEKILEHPQLTGSRKQKLYQTFALNRSRQSSDVNVLQVLQDWQTRFVSQARETALNEQAGVKERVAAIEALTVSREASDADLLLDLLDSRSPEAIQLAAMNTLVAVEGSGTDDAIIELWAGFSPGLRKQAQQAMFSRPAWTTRFLKAILAGEIPRADVDRAQLQVVKSSKASATRELAEKVTTFLQDSPRAEVIENFRASLDLGGDVANGRAIFVKHCASCHQLEGTGKPIGPNLSSFKNRGKEAFLVNILDPSREVTPDYLSYLVVTTDGRSYTGLLAAQSATTISLQRAEGEPLTILRADIEEMRSSGISLMPEGLEKDLDVSGMADLLTYLMQTE